MNRRSFAGVALAGLAGSVLGGLGTGCRTSGHGGARLRVLTYNVHHGEGVDGRLDLERIAGVIRAAQPDLVALQEVDRQARRTGGVDQAAEYARRTGLRGWYGPAMAFQGGEYGQALLARWPLEDPRVVRLPGTAGREPRIAVTARVSVPGAGTLQWTGLHLDAQREDGDRWVQVQALRREFTGLPRPVLLAGDFNAEPETRVMRHLLGSEGGWTDTAGTSPSPTVPAEAPRRRIDYILAAPADRWVVESSMVLSESVASDHRPLLAVLRLPSQRP